MILPVNSGMIRIRREIPVMAEDWSNGINRQALFADETSDYRMPEEPDAGDLVRLRFRTAKGDVEHVYYVEEGGEAVQELTRTRSEGLFDYYTCEVAVGNEPRHYYFQVVKKWDICYFNRLGVTEDAKERFAFCMTPGFHTPEWAKGAVMYQIFVDRFCNGDPSNDVEDREYIYAGRPVHRVEDWNAYPSAMDVGRFYGGDLQGVWNKLDYLQYLGVEVIYFNPLFVSPSNHKYDTQDYDYIDPHYGVIVKDGGEPVRPAARGNKRASRYRMRSAGIKNLEASNELFVRFMEEIHRRGMRVILDGVFNHCGSFNKWMDREELYARQGGYEPGAYHDANSPYRSFFKFRSDNSYEGWWDYETLPKLNYEDSPKLYDDIMRIGRKWVSEPYCVDGWRLDVAADLGHSLAYNHQFWQGFRRVVKEANPEAIILAEHYGDPESWLQGDEWDAVMNYDAFMEPLTWFLTGMEKHSDVYDPALYGNGAGFFRSMYSAMSRMPGASVMTAMNQLSNHDHSRFLTRTNHMAGRLDKSGPEKAGEGISYGIFREAVLVQMTWPGAPTLYYGDEAGVCGWTDPDSRRTYPWGHEDFELIEYHRYLIALHKTLPALRRGSVKQLLADRQLIAYGRMRGQNRCVVVINNRGEDRTVEVPVWELGVTDHMALRRVMLTYRDGYNVGQVDYYAEHGILTLELPANSGILLTTEIAPEKEC